MDPKHQRRISRPTLIIACAEWFGAGLMIFVAVFILFSLPSYWALLFAGFTAFSAYRCVSAAVAMTARFRAGLPPSDA